MVEYVMLLFHGTSDQHLDAIQEEGLEPGACLTDRLDIAEYYADEAAEETGGEPVVLHVEVNETHLHADVAAIEEPVMQQARYQEMAISTDRNTDECVWAAAETACRQEGVENWAELSGSASLELVNSCQFSGPSRIMHVDW